jgi:mannose-6-phosphate isomerase-like protein (cupin superfamily)
MQEIPERGSIRNVVEVMWQDLAGHFGGAYSKFLVRPETCGARRIDYRISTYQPKAYVETHTHAVQEQVYHVLVGEGLMELDGVRRVVRRHDVVFVPPGVAHAIYNTGLEDLTFIVVTSPPEDGPAEGDPPAAPQPR